MNVAQLFQIQHHLDKKITENHQLEEHDLIPAKILALQVELGELANETKCFKFWSVKPPSDRGTILEEYVDGIHFILSIGLDKGYQDSIELTTKEVELSQMECFARLFESISAFSQNQSIGNYQRIFQMMLDLGQVLGFSWADIEQAYLVKNEINHARQAEGY